MEIFCELVLNMIPALLGLIYHIHEIYIHASKSCTYTTVNSRSPLLEVRKQVHVCVCDCVCMSVHICVCMYVHVCMCMPVFVCVCIRSCVHECVYMRVCVSMCVSVNS